MNKLIVICGPTGTGKTKLGISLCQTISAKGQPPSKQGEIISADSRQVYRYANIGTNKKEVRSQDLGIRKGKGFWVQDSVKIHLYDIATPDKQYSASRFIDDAAKIIKNLWKQNKLPIIVGGTGFYISALIGDIKLSGVPADTELREILKTNSLENLQTTLQGLSQKSFQKMNNSEKQNKHRLIRAIEIAIASRLGTKKPIQKRAALPNTQVLKIGLTAPRNFLYQKADSWVARIVKNGLLDETQSLLQKGYRDTRLLQGMIYAPAVLHLDTFDKFSKKQMLEQICLEMHAYIRRQITWFKRDKKIVWFDITKVGFDKKVERLVELFVKHN